MAVHVCGGVGLSAVHVADAVGANVVAVAVAEAKLELADRLGADETVDASEIESPANEVKAIADGGADVSVDALDTADTCRNSVRCLARLGQYVQVALTTSEEGGEIPLPIDEMAMKKVEFIGSLGMQPTRYDEIFRMVENGKIDPGAVVPETVALEDVSDTFEAITDYETEGIPVVTEFV